MIDDVDDCNRNTRVVVNKADGITDGAVAAWDADPMGIASTASPRQVTYRAPQPHPNDNRPFVN